MTFAHDLRAFLRTIALGTQRIQRKSEELSPEIKSRLDEILDAARKQDELISAMVEYGQALAPGLSGDNPLSIKLVIQTACRKIDTFLQQKEGLIQFNAQTAPPVLVPSGAARVIEKIIHNSLKFRSADKPVIEVSVSTVAAELIEVRISDNGLGIERQYRGTVLEPFKRLNPASEYPGSGLGLSICRRLLESVGGTIHIEDPIPPSQGVAVVARMPTTRAAAA